MNDATRITVKRDNVVGKFDIINRFIDIEEVFRRKKIVHFGG